MSSGSGFGDDVYQPQSEESDRDFVEQLDDQDTLISGVGDPLDQGYSPVERPLGLKPVPTFSDRLAEELPEVGTDDGWDGMGDSVGTDGELLDDQVGGARSGRLVAPDEGSHPGGNADLCARDVGIDGAAASAEEAAMHVVDEDELERDETAD